MHSRKINRIAVRSSASRIFAVLARRAAATVAIGDVCKEKKPRIKCFLPIEDQCDF